MEHSYIGLCFGAPGVGKTRSARVYANCDLEVSGDDTISHSVFYTVPVHHAPTTILREINQERQNNRTSLASYRSIESELDQRIGKARATKRREFEEYEKVRDFTAYSDFPWTSPHDIELVEEKRTRLTTVEDPTRLIIVDESDRLRISGLEQVRDIFDRDGNIGLVLIGMPGLEKRLARYPQLYSRVGFVHEFRPLGKDEARELVLSMIEHDNSINDEGIAAVLRSGGGNFRLTEKLMAQVTRILAVNELSEITEEVVNAARESLVIGID